jgi:hypothetical protein
MMNMVRCSRKVGDKWKACKKGKIESDEASGGHDIDGG